ncbi:MAG: hypothetical protein JWO05_2460 [Gemmatimonadetes bacterium]|nr:hypothetical protein [Gemmatimonadota bacterium]
MRKTPSLNLKNRDGFALPMAILVIAVLTAAIAAGFAATSAEIATVSSTRGQNRAYAIAQTGLEQFLVRRSESGFCSNCTLTGANAPPVADSEWTTVPVPGGYAQVVSHKIRGELSATQPALYFITSRGVDTTAKLGGAGYNQYAERTVGVYTTFSTIVMNVLSSWTSLSGITKNGNAGNITGVDECGQKATVAGGMTTAGDFNGDPSAFSGNPPLDQTKNLTQLKAAVQIDWASIIGGGIAADVTIGPGTFPTVTQFADTSYWPVIRIHTNNYSLPNAGRGLIIADSDFTISGSNMWDGIVLVGGQLTSNGNNTTKGATVSGLNLLINGTALPGVTTDNATQNGTKQYIYSSCNVARAGLGLRAYKTLPNTWMDNVAIY